MCWTWDYKRSKPIGTSKFIPPALTRARASIARSQRAMASVVKLPLRRHTTQAVFSELRASIVAGTKSAA